MRAIPRTKLVWLTLPAATVAGASIRFPDIPELRGKRIIGVEAYDESVLSFTPDLVAVVIAADIVGLSLVLKEDSTERVQDTPLAALLPQNVFGVWKQFVAFVVNWQSSFVRVNATPGVLPCSVPLNIFYED